MNKLLIANRGEIAIRVCRAASELGIRTVALYSYEDRYSLHRYKADEAYQIGQPTEALKPYLDIPAIIALAKKHEIDAIHPGYGFLSENLAFVNACAENNIVFIGPSGTAMDALGDKRNAKKLARSLSIPVIEDNQKPIQSVADISSEAARIGYPVLVKAAAGGGGRGMRVVHSPADIAKAYDEARNEALRAFGDASIFLEKYIANPKHIEVQILADSHGNTVHLYERDCSIQRRFQKVVEVAPSIALAESVKQKLFEAALAIARAVDYKNAGTVEFLVDQEDNYYFIEVNPRIQVEHTVTEEITGIDIVRAQICIARGDALSDPSIGIRDQESIQADGVAIQCRVTTEDPQNDFQPQFGTLSTYRSPGGYGIRLDAGSAYTGAEISPFFDSLLVKITGRGRSLTGAAKRLSRALKEFRVRGVTNNIPFLLNVLSHPEFLSGATRVHFIENNPELLHIRRGRDRATKLLRYIAEVVVNGNPDIADKARPTVYEQPKVPPFDPYAEHPAGTKDRLTLLGRDAFLTWLQEEKKVQYTDTTFRDAHQSLLATRVRTTDLLNVAESFAKNNPNIFSMEVWGGATFDVAMRFLHECPWKRLELLRASMPNVLLQMLLRGSNAVGYTAYPDNLIQKFIIQSAESGIDIFRIFDALNWVPNMAFSIKTVVEDTSALAEACICYTGDIANPMENKYTLDYYLDLAKKLEDCGAHILAIKDMAGLLRPYSAHLLISRLKETVSLPIHLHTHDTAGIQAATYLRAIEAGVDIIDVALASMSGLTSQPNFNSIVAALEHSDYETDFSLAVLNDFSNYWEVVRQYYSAFESGLRAGTATVYHHEIPGGQYSNLRPQAQALGLADRFHEIKQNYCIVDELLGRLVKVTPSSKVVGDLALFMTSNNLTADDLLNSEKTIAFPDSVKNFFRGDLGQPYGGFPKELQERVLAGETPRTGRANDSMTAIDFSAEFKAFKSSINKNAEPKDLLSYLLYPKVYQEFHRAQLLYGDVSVLPTEVFFYGLRVGEEILVDIEPGKRLIISLTYVSDPDEDGMRSVHFSLNGQTRSIIVRDTSVRSVKQAHRKAQSNTDIAAPLQGKLSEICVTVGQEVEKGAALFVIEAMKMETSVMAPYTATVQEIVHPVGTVLEQDDLVVVLNEAN